MCICLSCDAFLPCVAVSICRPWRRRLGFRPVEECAKCGGGARSCAARRAVRRQAQEAFACSLALSAHAPARNRNPLPLGSGRDLSREVSRASPIPFRAATQVLLQGRINERDRACEEGQRRETDLPALEHAHASEGGYCNQCTRACGQRARRGIPAGTRFRFLKSD